MLSGNNFDNWHNMESRPFQLCGCLRGCRLFSQSPTCPAKCVARITSARRDDDDGPTPRDGCSLRASARRASCPIKRARTLCTGFEGRWYPSYATRRRQWPDAARSMELKGRRPPRTLPARVGANPMHKRATRTRKAPLDRGGWGVDP